MTMAHASLMGYDVRKTSKTVARQLQNEEQKQNEIQKHTKKGKQHHVESVTKLQIVFNLVQINCLQDWMFACGWRPSTLNLILFI